LNPAWRSILARRLYYQV